MRMLNLVKKLFFPVIFCLALLVFGSGQVSASELEEQAVSIADSYVNFDSGTNKFIINPEINEVLSNEEISEVSKQVQKTNDQLQAAVQDTKSQNQVLVEDSVGNQKIIKPAMVRGAGVNSISFHWNYARIKINASNLRLGLSAGFGIAGVWVPGKVLGSILVVLGVSAGNIKHGIWFDYNYFIGILCGSMGFQ